MAEYWDEMFNTQGESTSLADLQQGSSATAGPYQPQFNGRIKQVRLLQAGEAATSLMENVRVELKCTIWTPNLLKFGLVGAGLRTAPAFPIPMSEHDFDQPVNTNQNISGQYIYADAATPVTCNLRVFGKFSCVNLN